MKIRVEKFLSENTSYSRREIKKFISNRRIKVNDIVIKKSEQIHFDDVVKIDNHIIKKQEQFIYLLLNKSSGYVCANIDKINKTVFDLIDSRYLSYKGIHTVGRLDKDTEGLLLITNDGELTHELLAPKKHVIKKYFVRLNGNLDNSLIKIFEKGFDIGEKNITKPSTLEILNNNECFLSINEGKFHQVKRMFLKFGLEVIYLKRVKFANLNLPKDLKKGEYIEIKRDQII
ncbi:rRNA pseudouridine synthase [Mycoplasma sp. CSL10137]|uniref:pseudouridine synthase n=1 Tax=unclassified Mycoplasma TaxID=2683645 RepID=UPI00197CA463|nr:MULTISPECIES: pseudouridine synthase [unclassified Mycoplasma]MBN4083212.1 rRNA pseudouridine synthase [Mycoplasma sp. CSL10137]MBN4084492.1 rRNA pseudouridine synthase [Mycoplasma sp. CSL10166]MBU4692971.1 rRNA pseudouridine synthase [Mycoplasma sp. CSL7491-lung]